MKRLLISLIMMMTLGGIAQARTMRQMFNLMPDSVLPILTRINRLDMFDFMDSGMDAQVTNRLGGVTRMTSLSQTTLTLQYTNNTDITMHLFFRRDTIPVVCVIRTVQSGIEDSRIDFYDDTWNHLETRRIIREPLFQDYLDRQYLKSDSLQMFRDRCSLMSRKVTVSEDGKGLVFKFTGTDYLGQEAGLFSRFVSPEGIRYAWNGRRLRRIR